jgi:hypothetical protein
MMALAIDQCGGRVTKVSIAQIFPGDGWKDNEHMVMSDVQKKL